jgi:hypothetical protein
MGIGSLGGLGDRTARSNTRLTSFTSPTATLTGTGTTNVMPNTVTLLPATPAEMLWFGFHAAYSGVGNGGLLTLRGYIGDQVRVGGTSYACAFDSQGNFYFFDSNANVIRKMAAGTRLVTTFFGNGTAANTNGTGTGGSVTGAAAICFDASDTMYVGINTTFRGVKAITTGGVMTTLAGNTTVTADLDATGTAAQFQNVTGLCTDPAGNVYTTNQVTPRIRKITPAGVVTSFAGSGTVAYTDGAAGSAAFNAPKRIAYDATTSTLVVTDTAKVRRVALDGTVSTISGTGTASVGNGPVGTATFQNVYGVCVTSNGDIYVGEASASLIRKISGGQVTTINGATALPAQSADVWNYVFQAPGTQHFALAPNGTQMVVQDANGTTRYRLIDLNTNGMNVNYLGDSTSGTTNGVAEMQIAEASIGMFLGTTSSYASGGYMPFPAPVRVPAGVRLAANYNQYDTGGNPNVYVRAVLGYPGSFE